MKTWLLALAITVLPSWSSARDFAMGDLIIEHPFFRATPPAVETGAGYMTIINNGTESDRLVAIESAAADKVEFHQTVIVDGIASMRPVPEGFAIPPGGSIVIGADGTHAMLIGLSAMLVEGGEIDGTLVFERAGRVPVVFAVEPIGTPTEGHGDGHGQ